MAMKVWLAQRMEVLLPQLALLGVAQEQEIKHLCEQEIEAWRARPTMKEISSLRVPMTDTRNAIKELELTQDNRWKNPRTGAWEHIALKYMNFSEEEWAAMNAAAERDFAERLESQQLVEQPLAVIEQARRLLASSQWEEVVVGLAVLTGRRLTEVLKTGLFHPMSQYTVIFEGQLKRKDEILPPYEIPTLVEAAAVLDAWQRVRSSVDCTQMSRDEVAAAYSRTVGEVAKRAFHGLVPVRTNDEDLYTHLDRTIYARLAVWLYCPVQVTDLTYMATIQGHYWVLNAETEEKRRNYMSTLHYIDYAIGDGAGNIDGRHGIALGTPGVKVLDAFAEAIAKRTREAAQRQETMHMTTAPTTQRRSRTGRGLLQPRQHTKERFKQVEARVHMATDETLSLLLDEHALFQQLLEVLHPVAPQIATAAPGETAQMVLKTVQLLVEAYVRQHTESHAFEARWGVTLADVSALFENVAATGESRPATVLLTELVAKQHQQRQKHQQRRHETQYDQMPFSVLKGRREPEAAEERVRRAVAALMSYNERCTDPVQRWYINASLVHALLGGRYAAIQESLQAHKGEIEEHHEALEITQSMNYKGKELVAQRVKILEEPSVSSASQAFSLGVGEVGQTTEDRTHEE